MNNSASERGRILIVDDDQKILDLLTELLELEGYEVASASDGAEAFDLLPDRCPHCAQGWMPADVEFVGIVEDLARLQVIAGVFNRLFLSA